MRMTKGKRVDWPRLAMMPALLGALTGATPPDADTQAAHDADRCRGLVDATGDVLGVPTARVAEARIVKAKQRQDWAGSASSEGMPEHCEIEGLLRERTGSDGQDYAVKFRIRLPLEWNGRFLFQGGGGTNGFVGTAAGPIMPNVPGALTALERGFAVVATDYGHDNMTNYDKSRGGIMAFGHDFEARAELADRSFASVAVVAKNVIAAFYGRAPDWSYFVGCSNGGYTGMAFAQRYPDQFDGIYSGAPAFAVPKASVGAIWQSQQLAKAARADGHLDASGAPDFASVFSDADLALVSQTVANVCDADDGIQDGLVQDFERCTTSRVEPALRALTCTGEKADSCLSSAQVDAMVNIHEGPVNSAGEALYASFPWDTGVTNPDWRFWKLNMGDALPANVSLMAAGLAAVFATPPVAVEDTREAKLRYVLGFDFDTDAPTIFTATNAFPRSGWDMFDGQSDNLGQFRSHGGKMIVAHGSSDPVFSIHDTARWWRMVDGRFGGNAADFVRLFSIPGQDHCGSGNAVDQFDSLTPLMKWVESGQAPDRIVASAGPKTPWSGRSRPLCPYPFTAFYKGGDPESASSFECRPSEE